MRPSSVCGAGRDGHAAAAARGHDRAGVEQAAALGQRRVGGDGVRRPCRPARTRRSARPPARAAPRRRAAARPRPRGRPARPRPGRRAPPARPGSRPRRRRGARARARRPARPAPRSRARAVLLREPDQRVEDDDGQHDQAVLDSPSASARAPAASSAHISGVRTWSSSSRAADGPAASGRRWGRSATGARARPRRSARRARRRARRRRPTRGSHATVRVACSRLRRHEGLLSAVDVHVAADDEHGDRTCLGDAVAHASPR